MLGVNPYYLLGSVIGSLFGVYMLSLLFRYALLGRSGTKLQQLWVVMLTGLAGLGFYSFNEGTNGFVSRMTTPPDLVQATIYAACTLVVAFFVWFRAEDVVPAPQVPAKTTTGIVGRSVAIVFVVPVILIGLGNLGGSAYSIAAHGMPGPGLGVSKSQMRIIMLEGDMAPFWQMLDAKSPADMDYIIDRVFAHEASYQTGQDALRQMNSELADYRISLATYGAALTDEQRKEIIEGNAEILRSVSDQPEVCVSIAMTGGVDLSQDQLRPILGQLNHLSILTTESLLDARLAASNGIQMPPPPTDDDYALLGQVMIDGGISEDGMMAMINQDTTHPDFCMALIAFLEGMLKLQGSAGVSLRFETAQGLLTAAP